MPRTTAPGAGNRLPDDPGWIEFPRSDGDPRRWPTNTERKVVFGEVNFMAPVRVDEALCIGWRITVGNAVAAKMGLPEGKSYVLKSWPDGYQMYDHHKGAADMPRHDPYLIGSINARRFRSAREFINHAYWLITDPTLNSQNCECKYCDGGTPQHILSQRIPGLSPRSSLTPAPIPAAQRHLRPPNASRPVNVTPRDYTRTEVKPKESLAENGPKVAVDQQRVNDCRAATSRNRMNLLRWLRYGELVWCRILPQPLAGKIEYWPGTIIGQSVRASAVKPRTQGSSSANTASALSTSQTVIEGSSASATDLTEAGLADWDVVQWTEYRVKLIGVNRTVDVQDTSVLPYQVYGPEPEIWEHLRDILTNLTSIDWTAASQFDPISVGQEHALDEREQRELLRSAVLPYSLAVCAAGQLAAHWTPTHAFYTKASRTRSNPHPAHNTRGVQGGTRTEWQGLWWGPERIWADDFVRLKPYRGDYAPMGGEHIRPPSGPGRSTIIEATKRFGPDGTGSHSQYEAWSGVEDMHRRLGAGSRGLFMQITSLHSIDPPANSGSESQMYVAGMLYELADEGWEELPGAKVHPPVSTLRHPLISHPNPLPVAPAKYWFRPILDPGHEAIIPVGLVAGRYYARINDHPYLQPLVDAAYVSAGESLDPDQMPTQHLLSLYGLISGQHNAVDPTHWAESRAGELQDALEGQKRHIEKLWRDNRKHNMGSPSKRNTAPPPPGVEIMDVDSS